jgi:hypothetical protein
MEEVQTAKKLIDLARATVRSTTYLMRIQAMLSEPLATNNGVKQGDALAYLLFKSLLDTQKLT